MKYQNKLEDVSFRNRENLQYKKTVDSVLMSLFMRTYGKCNNAHAPSSSLSSILLFSEPTIPVGPEYEKYQHYIDVRGEVNQLHKAQRQLLRPINNLKEKSDPSEIGRTYNTIKQQTWFY